jgi:histidinol phosphatase-like enzyme
MFAVASLLISITAFQVAAIRHKPGCDTDHSPKLTTEILAEFTVDDFKSDLVGDAMESDIGVAVFSAATSEALFGQFITGVVIDFDKCGINLPHIHPRATEIAMVLEG